MNSRVLVLLALCVARVKVHASDDAHDHDHTHFRKMVGLHFHMVPREELELSVLAGGCYAIARTDICAAVAVVLPDLEAGVSLTVNYEGEHLFFLMENTVYGGGPFDYELMLGWGLNVEQYGIGFVFQHETEEWRPQAFAVTQADGVGILFMSHFKNVHVHGGYTYNAVQENGRVVVGFQGVVFTSVEVKF